MTIVQPLVIAGYIVIIALLLALLFIRNYRVFKAKIPRLNIFNVRGQFFLKALKLFFLVGLAGMAVNIPVYGFIGLATRYVIPEFLNFSLMIVSIIVVLTEIPRCFTVAESTLNKTAKKIWFTAAVLITFPMAVYFAYYIPQIFEFPATKKCVLLDLPVKENWLAAHAGGSILTNQHNFVDFQKYAVDMVKINEDRSFFNNKGNALTDYPTFGADVVAPCDGIIAHVDDTIQDIPPSITASNLENPGGNYISIQYSDSVFVILAHLQKGSITVAPGDYVVTGQKIATVGNSGNTTWPHLHFHVQNRPKIILKNNAEGLPFRFKKINRKRWFALKEVENAFLLRNDVFSNIQ